MKFKEQAMKCVKNMVPDNDQILLDSHKITEEIITSKVGRPVIHKKLTIEWCELTEEDTDGRYK